MIKFITACVLFFTASSLYYTTIMFEPVSPDILNGLIFMESELYYRLQIPMLYPQHIGQFLFLNILLILFSTREISDHSSLMQMLAHRSGKKALFRIQFSSLLKSVWLKILVLGIISILFTFVFFPDKGLAADKTYIILSLIMFFIRFGLIIYTIVFLQEYLSFHLDNKYSIVVCSMAAILIIIIDMAFGTGLITFKSELSSSLVYTIVDLAVSIISTLIIYKKQLMRREY